MLEKITSKFKKLTKSQQKIFISSGAILLIVLGLFLWHVASRENTGDGVPRWVLDLYKEIKNKPYQDPEIFTVPEHPDDDTAFYKQYEVVTPSITETRIAQLPMGGNAVSITDVFPNGSAQNPSQVVIEFNTDMAPMNAPSVNPNEVGFSLSPHIDGALHWVNKNTLVYEFQSTPNKATLYSVKLKQGLKSLDNQILTRDVTFSFETSRPRVLQHHIRDFYKTEYQASTTPEIYVFFDQRINPASVEKYSYIEYENKYNALIKVPVTIKRFIPDKNEEDWELKNADPKKTFRISPVRALPHNKACTLHTIPGVRAQDGDLLSNDRFSWEFKTCSIPAFLGIQKQTMEHANPYSLLELKFATPVNTKSLYESIRIYPNQNVTFNIFDEQKFISTFEFPSQILKPAQNYVIFFTKPIVDIYGQEVQPGPYVLYVDHIPPFIGDLGKILVQEKEKQNRIPVQIRNITSLNIEAIELTTDDQLLYFYEHYIIDNAYSPTPDRLLTIKKTLHFNKLKQDLDYLYPLNINDLSKDASYNPFLIRIKDQNGFYKSSILQLTNLGVTVKIGDLSGLVWTNLITEGRTYPDVTIKIYNYNNKALLWSGKTGSTGRVIIPGVDYFKKNFRSEDDLKRGLFIVASSAKDKAFLRMDWDQGISKEDFTIFNNVNNQYRTAIGEAPIPNASMDSDARSSGVPWASHDIQDSRAYIFIERPLFTPGERVNYKVILRHEELRRLEQIPKGQPVTLTVYNSNQETIVTQTLRINDNSAVIGNFNIPKTAPLGSYTISVSTKSMKYPQSINFSVEEFKKKNFEAKVSTPKAELASDEKIDFNLFASYLHGGEMKDHKVKYNIYGERTWFRPEGYSGFDFSYQDPEQIENQIDSDSNRITSTTGETKTDNKGTISKSITPESVMYPVSYTGQFTVFDSLNDFTLAQATVLVHPADFYMGSACPAGLIPAGMNTPVDIVVVDIQGKLVKEASIQVEIFNRSSTVVRHKSMGNMFIYNQTPTLWKESSDTLKYLGLGTTYQFKPKQAGEYYVVFSTKDSKGRVVKCSRQFSVYGGGDPQWRLYDHDRIDVIADKANYTIGDTAKLLIKSPFTSGQALITLEREGIIDSFVITINSASPVFELPIKKEYFPNMYVGVNLIQGRLSEKPFASIDLGKPMFRVGYTSFKVDDKAFRLNISAATDKTIYKPGSEVSLTIKTTDRNNSPQIADIAVAVVDEALLNLMPYVVDPYTVFFADRYLTVMSAENRVFFYGRRNYGQKGINLGGGGGADFNIEERKKFLNAAYWNPSLSTGKNGIASVKFRLPDNLTTYQIILLAQTRDNKFGHTFYPLKVSKALALFPIFPSFLTEGDMVKAGDQVHNLTSAAGTAQVLSSFNNMKLTGTPLHNLSMQKNSVQDDFYDLVAGKEGIASYSFRARLGAETDGLAGLALIYSPYLYDTNAEYGVLTGNVIDSIKLPAGTISDRGQLKITLSTSMISAIQGAVDYLSGYPYLCLEQKYSKAVGTLGALALSEKTLAEATAQQKDFIQQILVETREYQKPDNGFSFWPESRYSSFYLTYYVASILIDLEDNGYPTAGTYLPGLDGYFTYRFNSAVKDHDFHTLIQAYHYLARRHRETPAMYENVMKNTQKYNLTQLLTLADALHYTQNQQMAGTVFNLCKNYLTKQSGNVAFVQGTSADRFNFMMESNLYNNILALRIWLKLAPDDPKIADLARYLQGTQKKQGYWLNTQENAQMILAFLDYVQIKEKDRPNYRAVVSVNNQNLGTYQASSILAKAKDYTLPIGNAAIPLNVSLNKEGRGTGYYRIEVKNALRSLTARPKDYAGFVINRKYFDQENKQIEGSFDLGKMYRVEVTMTFNTLKDFVLLEDHLPAGFEIINPGLGGGADVLAETFKKYYSTQGYASISWIEHQEYRLESASAFGSNLAAGTYRFSYFVRAAYSGEFLARASSAEEMYNPEIQGRSIAQIIKIK